MKHPFLLPGRNLQKAYIFSVIIGFVMLVLSLLGVINQDLIYRTEQQREAFVPNDVVNIIIALPILLVSMWLANRGKLVGLLFWPGALLYNLYNYIVYLVGLPISLYSIGYFGLVLLSAILIYNFLRDMDKAAIHEQLSGGVPVRLSGWYLLAVGALVFIRALVMFGQAMINQTGLPLTEIGLLVADLLISTAWMAGGVLLLQRKPLGYAIGLGLLYATCMLFLGLDIIILVLPVLTGAPLMVFDLVVVSIMTVIFSVPFFLYLRCALSKETSV